MMKWFFTSIIGFFVSFFEYLVKKFGFLIVAVTIKKTVSTLYIAFLITAVAFISTYLIRLWTAFKELLKLPSSGSVGGAFGGIDNSQLLSSAYALLHESGLATALVTVGNLFIGFLSLYFAIQAYKLYMYVTNNFMQIIDDLLRLYTR